MTTNDLVQAINGADYATCVATRDAVEARIDELQTVKGDELRARFAEEAAALGLDIDEVIGGRRGKTRRGRPRANGPHRE